MAEEITSVSRGGFLFCRIGLTILIWIGFFLRIKEIILLSVFFLLFSAILTVKRAPMILIWDYTFGLLIKTKKEILNINAMRFAHSLGAIFSGIGLILIFSPIENIGWGFIGVFALIKTISALGFCPASKIYKCASNGGSCCTISKKLRGSCNA
jgi:hypothetical protein